MLRGIRPAHGLRFGLCTLAAVVGLAAITTEPADARWRRGKRHHYARVAAYTPPYADIVVDANSGEVMHATNADSLRHPASLTKIMTLYLLFEQLEAGKLRLDSRLEVSEHASEQAPSKLGLVPGQTIAVEDAIRALVTKSANDVAVVVAEAIGGDEDTFGRMMTRKARALGMSRTVYVNASGLPDKDQITTARDQATLGRAIQDRFPREYRYFGTPVFVYRGWAMRNHNKLLGRVQGVDGIKTGYTRDSGFNLVSSVRRGGRQRRRSSPAEAGHSSAAAAALRTRRHDGAGCGKHGFRRRHQFSHGYARDPGAAPGRLLADAPAEARLGRADQPGEGEDHHGEGRERPDRDDGPDFASADRHGRPAAFRQKRACCCSHARETGCARHLPSRVRKPDTGDDRLRPAPSAPSARTVDYPAWRIPQGSRSAGSLARGAVARKEHAGEGRPFHRAGHEGQPGALPRPLCRLR